MENQSNPFPVEWDNPADAQEFWVLDLVHCPEPISRLDFDLRMNPLFTGIRRSSKRIGLPIDAEVKLINGFIFNKIIDPTIAPEALPDALKAVDENVRREYAELQQSWETKWLPEVQKIMAELAAFDVQGASLSALIAHLDELRTRNERVWELHNDVLVPSLLALSDFDEAHRDIFADAKTLDVYDLLGGLPNKTTEANIRLWEIGRTAARTPALRTLIVDNPLDKLQAALEQSAEGRALWGAIQDYARTYGERNDDLIPENPTWVEDPTPVLRGLREAVLQPDRDLEAEMKQHAEQREAKLAKIRETLVGHPKPVVEEFERLLKAAQMATILTEDHHYWIDCKVTYHIRRVVLEIGKRLAQRGVIENTGDVFQLSLAELQELGEDISAETSARLRALVVEHRAAAARFAGVTPPNFLGVPRQFLPMDCAIMRVSVKFSGNIFVPPGEPGADLVGMAGSSGKVTGPARIVRSLDDAAKLQRGDILVAAFTLPSWTPFFATVAGVVTNIGGILCHAAVVAREYRIPAVVSTVRATETLKDGQMIEVDGDAGVVRLVSASA